MSTLEKMIKEIRRQLLPYRHDQDTAKDFDRWDVNEEECLTAWLLDQIAACRKKNGCEKRGTCTFYGYSDISKRNYDICYEIQLLLESGDLHMARRVGSQGETPKK
jgi:hypothetical protein